MTGNGPRLTFKITAALGKEPGVRSVATTEYHLQTNEQIERFNATRMSRLGHYLAEHERDWDISVFLLTYPYSLQVPRTTKLPPSSLVITILLPGPTAIARLMRPDVNEIDSPLAYRLRLIHHSPLL